MHVSETTVVSLKRPFPMEWKAPPTICFKHSFVAEMKRAVWRMRCLTSPAKRLWFLRRGVEMDAYQARLGNTLASTDSSFASRQRIYVWRTSLNKLNIPEFDHYWKVEPEEEYQGYATMRMLLETARHSTLATSSSGDLGNIFINKLARKWCHYCKILPRMYTFHSNHRAGWCWGTGLNPNFTTAFGPLGWVALHLRQSLT